MAREYRLSGSVTSTNLSTADSAPDEALAAVDRGVTALKDVERPWSPGYTPTGAVSQGRERPRLTDDYWTVSSPIMPSAACGLPVAASGTKQT